MMASQAWNLRPYRRLFCLLWFMNGFAVDYPPRLQHSSPDRQAEEISQDNRQLLLRGSRAGRCVLIQVCNNISESWLDTTGNWILIMWHSTQRQAGSAEVLVIFLCSRAFSHSVIQRSVGVFCLDCGTNLHTAVKYEKVTFSYNPVHVQRSSFFPAVTKSTALSGRWTIFVQVQAIQRKFASFDLLPRTGTPDPRKGGFCAFHSHFLPDSLFQVSARRAVCLVRVAGPEQVQPSLEGAVAFTGADSQDLGVEVEKISDVGAA